ncbi:uncharacterized protein LOC144044494 isoform X2 [Vanacampus margaritifer]
MPPGIKVQPNTVGKPGSKLEDLRLGEDLPWLTQIHDKQELTDKQNVMQLLYKLFKRENEIVPEKPGETMQVEGNETEGGLERKASREVRRPGCRIFFWKSWTAC